MTVQDGDIGTQARAFAQAIGLLDGDGNLDPTWFEAPLDALADILSDTAQRDAVVELLDELLPVSTGAPDGWREILDDSGFRLFLTTETAGSSLRLGVAGTLTAPNDVTITLLVPLVEAPGGGASPDPIVGSADGPIRVDVRVPLGLVAPPVGLTAIQGAIELQFDPDVRVDPMVELIGLQLGTAPASDFRFDAQDPGGDVVELVIGLLEDALSQPGVPPELRDHLLPLLGLATGASDIPELPLLRLPDDPSAFRGWIGTLVEGSGLAEWLSHLAGLVGAPTAVSGSGGKSDQWRAALFRQSDISLDLTVAVADGRVWPGLELRAGEDQDTDPDGLHVSATAVVFGLPYGGLDDPVLAPDIELLVRSPAPLVAPGGPFSCGRLQAGARWDGASIVPALELFDVVIDGTTHERVDLTQTEEVAGLAQSTVEAALSAMVGPGPGQRLLALVGLAPPASAPPTWPHSLDIPRFLVDPLSAVAAYYRAVLEDGTHSWADLHAELAAMLGLGGVSGTGTESDPWRFDLAASGPASVRVDAWRVSDGGRETLRIGLSVGAARPPFSTTAVAEILALTIPASGGPTLDVGARLRAQLVIDPLPAPPPMGSFTIRAGSIRGSVDWVPGHVVSWDVRVAGVVVTVDGTALSPIDLRFPGTLDFSDPAATAATLGLSTAELDAMVRGLVWRAARSWGGRDGQVLATLAGFGRGVWDLPDDLPVLGGDAGTLLTDPLGSVRTWLAELVEAPGSDGVVPITHLLRLAHAWLLGDHLPEGYGSYLDQVGRKITGEGTPTEPWRFHFDRTGALQAALWVGPDGPALPALPGDSGGDPDVAAWLAARLRTSIAGLAANLEGNDADRLSAGLEVLDTFFEESDGIVTVASQQPAGWSTPAAVTATHAALPGHPDVVSAIRGHVGGIAGSPVALLISAPFADRTSWNPLLTSAGLPGTTDPGAHFDLRVPDIPPSGVDLAVVTAAADWYTADLGDAGDSASEAAQIERIVGRMESIAPGRTVVLVAHSTSGNAARRVATSLPGRVAGIVTVGTPHLGARPPWATRDAAGLALHTARVIAAGLTAGPLRAAVEAATAIVDSAPDAPWTPAFFEPADTDLDPGALPALALAGRVGSGLLAAVESALRGREPPDRAAPEYVGIQLEAALGERIREVDLGVRAMLEIGIGEIGLDDGSLDARDPSVGVRVEIDGAGEWLVGGPGLRPDGTPWPVRCRGVILTATVQDGTADFQVEVHGAAAGVGEILDLDDARTTEILDAVFARLSAAPSASGLLDDLSALGLAVPAPGGGVALSSNAVSAFRTTGLAWLEPRLRAALDDGLAGLSLDLPVSIAPPIAMDDGFDVELSIQSLPTRVRLATTDDGIEIGDRARLSFAVEVGVPAGELSWEAALSVQGFELRLDDGALSATAGSWMEPLPLLPVDAAAVESRLEDILPRLVFSAATSALVEATLPEGIRLAPLDRLFGGGNGASGNGASGNGTGEGGTPPPDAATFVPILRMLNPLLGSPPDDSLALPGGLVVEVLDVPDATRFQLRTTSALGGVVDLQLGVDLGVGLTATPAAAVILTIPDGPNPPFVEVEFGHAAAGTVLVIRPAGESPITLLPSFSGFGSLLAGGVALLPRVLDELDDEIAAGPIKTAVLNVAAAIGVYDPAGGFAPHTARFQELLNGDWNQNGAQQAALVAAARSLMNQIPSLPGAVGGTGTTLTWSLSASGAATGMIGLGLDWADDMPTLSATVSDLAPAGSPVRLAATITVEPTSPAPFALDLAVVVHEPLDLPVRPRLALGAGPPGASLTLLPFASADGDGPLELTLLPGPDLRADPDVGERLAADVLLPLLLTLVDRAVGPDPLWTPGGPTLRQVLESAGLVDAGGAPVFPPPPILDVLAGAATSMSATLPLGDLELVLGNVGGGLGIGVSGQLVIPIDDITLTLFFEPPAGWVSSPPAAPVRLVLLQDTGGWTFSPRLDADGLGIGLGGTDGDLVRSDLFRLGGANAFVFFGLAFRPWSASFDGAGVELDGVGLPLNQLTGGGAGSNGVVAGLLGGGDAGAGEPGGAQPALGIDAWYLNDRFHVKFDGEDGPYWLSVQTSFGPLYIDQVGVGLMEEGGQTVGVDLLVDGGVSFAGLSVMVDDLTLGVPFRALGRPGDWTVDLAGLAVSYDGSGVRISGGLVKSETDAGVEYVGMLLVDVASFGLVAIGAWGSLADEEGEFTSLFIFAALFVTISFPPYLEIRGIGLGFGYNRRLVVPEDVTAISAFPLVAALDSGGDFLANPMAALQAMRQQVPARRGSYWFAVGFHGTTFVVVHITAVLYVALDSGVEVGVLGVARMMMPDEDAALVSIELALKARYSSSEGLLSIQGQLTDNSWLLSRDCQLTGGFAFFLWFERGQFLLTIGGYHPSFQREPEYPEVPRVGLRWDLGPIHIKGESYFALTNSAVMAGTRIEAAYSLGDWLRVWFKTWADFLLQWDPFHYDISVGIELGARVSFTVNLLFGKVRITLSISIGAELRLLGPPMRGVVKAKLGPFEVTVAFGSSNARTDYLDWVAFRNKYVLGEDPSAPGTAVGPGKGLLQPEEKGADPPTGLPDDPWRVNPEFGLRTETRMPSSSWRGPRSNASTDGSGVDDLDAAPMNAEALTADHVVTIERLVAGTWRDIRNLGAAALDWDPAPQMEIEVRVDRFPEAVWRLGKAAAASRNISAVGGLDLTFVAVAIGAKTAEIPILKLVDPLPRAPNPFTVRRGAWTRLRDRATVAVDLIEGATIADHLEIARTFLARGGTFEAARAEFGVAGGGLDGLALRVLEERTSPPRVASISNSLTMEPLAFTAPPDFRVALPVPPTVLESPRLRALAALPASVGRATAMVAAGDGSAPGNGKRPVSVALRTTVSNADRVPRVPAPRLEGSGAMDVLGARLVRVPPVGATPTTRAARTGRARSAAFTGSTSSAAEARRFEQLERGMRNGGVGLAPGEIHHWEVPAHDRTWRLTLDGDAAVRVLCLGRGSRVLTDREYAVTETREVEVPEDAHQIIAIGLGRPATGDTGPGAVSRLNAPGGVAAVGWQADASVFVATDSLLVARGSRIRLGAPTSVRPGRPTVASRAVAGVSVLQTWLPARPGTVMIVLERGGTGPISAPEVGILHGELGAPLEERAGRRHVWLYPVIPGDRSELAVTVATGAAWKAAGVVLLPGSPVDVGARLHGTSLPRFVSNGPLSESGAVRLSLTSTTR